MSTCCFFTLMSVLMAIVAVCLVFLAVMAYAIHTDLKNIHRTMED